MEGLDRTERTGVGLPMEVSKRKAGYQTGGDKFVDIVGVEVLDCGL